jgi:hypothetical protein
MVRMRPMATDTGRHRGYQRLDTGRMNGTLRPLCVTGPSHSPAREHLARSTPGSRASRRAVRDRDRWAIRPGSASGWMRIDRAEPADGRDLRQRRSCPVTGATMTISLRNDLK